MKNETNTIYRSAEVSVENKLINTANSFFFFLIIKDPFFPNYTRFIQTMLLSPSET